MTHRLVLESGLGHSAAPRLEDEPSQGEDCGVLGETERYFYNRGEREATESSVILNITGKRLQLRKISKNINTFKN